MNWDFNFVSEKILDFFFPNECVDCEKEGALLCYRCKTRLQPIKQFCFLCKDASPQGFVHQGCKESYFGLIPSRFLSASLYESPLVVKMLHHFKYGGVHKFAEEIAEIMVNNLNLRSEEYKNYVMTFVPMHPQKENLRGYNQSKLICEEISKITGMPYGSFLKKIKKTKPQMALNREQRLGNLHGVFSANTPNLPEKIILIDDVISTGSTILECSRILFQAGAQDVICLTFARN